jgi:hypothetical protein
LTESVQKFRVAAAAAVERPLIWIAPQNANELSGLFWYLDQLRPQDAEALIVDFPVPGGWRDEPPKGLGELSVERLALIFDRTPEPWDSNRFPRDQWAGLVREGALLRIVDNGRLQSAPSNFFDELILRLAPRAWTRWYRVVGDAMGNAWEARHHPDDSLLKWRLMELVRCGRLELSGDLSLYGGDQAAKVRRID